MTRLIVIVGSSGTGKSSLARALQEELLPEHWLHFSVDTVFYSLPRSVTESVDRGVAPARVDARAIVEGALACASTLLDLGHKLVFDAVILSPRGAERLMAVLGRHEPLVIELTCTWEKVARRTHARGDRTLAEAEHGFRNAAGHVAAHLSLDTSTRSPQEMAVQVAKAVPKLDGALEQNTVWPPHAP